MAHDDEGDDSGEYDLKPAEPVRRPPPPAVPRPLPPAQAAQASSPSARYQPAGLGTGGRLAAAVDAPRPSAFRKIVIGLLAGVLPLAVGVYLITRVAGGRGDSPKARTDAGGDGGTPGAGGTVGAEGGEPAERQATGTWPLPRDVAPAGKAKLAKLPLDIARADSAPIAGVLFARPDLAQAVAVAQVTSAVAPGGSGEREYFAQLDRYDLSTGKRVAAARAKLTSPGGYWPLDLSADGRSVLVAWSPGAGVFTFGDGPADITAAGEIYLMDKADHLEWAAFAGGDGRVVLEAYRFTGGARLAAFKPQPVGAAHAEYERLRAAALAAATPTRPATAPPRVTTPELWGVPTSAQLFKPRLSPGRRLVAHWDGESGGVRFLDVNTGKTVAALPSGGGRNGYGVAFDDAFTRAAVVWEDMFQKYLTIYDLSTGQPAAEFPVEQRTPPRAWLGPGHVMMEDGTVLDVQVGAPVWRYEDGRRVLHAAARPDGRYWYVTSRDPRQAAAALQAPGGTGAAFAGVEQAVLAAIALPHREALGSTAGGAGGVFAPTAGMRVAVKVELTGPSTGGDALRERMKARMEQALLAHKMVPDPAAAAALTVSAQVKDTRMYREFRPTGFLSGAEGAQRVPLRNLILKVELTDGAGGRPVPVTGFVVRDQSKMGQEVKSTSGIGTYLLDQQWAEAERRMPATFRLPAYLPRGGPAAKIQSSQLGIDLR